MRSGAATIAAGCDTVVDMTPRSARWMLVSLVPAAAALAGPPPSDAVWKPAPAAIERVHEELARKPDPAATLEAVMRSAGASAAAIAFSRRLGDAAGYLGRLDRAGRAWEGTLYFPLRAYQGSEPVAIDEVYPWATHEPPVRSTLPDGRIALVYALPLRACHGCADVAIARVAYVFGPDGKYRGRKLQDLKPAPPPSPAPSPR
jgi:hypothetical protein